MPVSLLYKAIQAIYCILYGALANENVYRNQSLIMNILRISPYKDIGLVSYMIMYKDQFLIYIGISLLYDNSV